MKNTLSLALIAAPIFLFVRYGAEWSESFSFRERGEDYREECQNEGCDTEEREELHESYESECFEESCDVEEVRETAGAINSINAMWDDFNSRGWTVSGCHRWGGCFYCPGNLGNAASGDSTFGPLCTQSSINQHWADFDFDKGDWDDGFGYDDPCNINQPLARTFNALNLLDFFGTSMPSGSSNWLPWFYAFASSEIDELDARCDFGLCNGCTFARNHNGVDDWTRLYWPFFYSLNVPGRASTIVHEARHADGLGHNGGSGCPRGASCDTTWGYNGANTFQVLYLWWVRAQGTGLTSAVRALAQARGNTILANGFNTRPTRAAVLGGGVSNPNGFFSIP